MMIMKALNEMKETAERLSKEDAEPAKVFEDVFIGSIGSAYNKDRMKELGITHILCCADKLKPKFPDVSKFINYFTFVFIF